MASEGSRKQARGNRQQAEGNRQQATGKRVAWPPFKAAMASDGLAHALHWTAAQLRNNASRSSPFSIRSRDDAFALSPAL
jgi:hypothetical protein